MNLRRAKKQQIRPKRRWRRLEQDVLVASANGWIRILMERRKVSRSELAKRMRKTLPDISQLLLPSRNLTLRTLADLAWALGASFALRPGPPFVKKVTPQRAMRALRRRLRRR